MASPATTVSKGAQQLVDPRGIGGMTAGVLAAPFARETIYGVFPNVFTGDNSGTASSLFLVGQGVIGGAMASGRMGRGGMTRAVGAGVGVEALRSILSRWLG